MTGFTQHGDGVTAAGLEARHLVAADGLHSTILRACGLDPPLAQHPRFGLRRRYGVAPWSDLVEVYRASGAVAVAVAVAVAEAEDEVAVLGGAVRGGAPADFEARLDAFPELRSRLAGAEPASDARGAGPLRQDVRRRVAGSVLLVGDAFGYLDALTGEGIGVALAQAEVLVDCLATGWPDSYERAWRRISRRVWIVTSGLHWSRHRTLIAPRIVPAAQRLPRVFTSIVNQVARA